MNIKLIFSEKWEIKLLDIIALINMKYECKSFLKYEYIRPERKHLKMVKSKRAS